MRDRERMIARIRHIGRTSRPADAVPERPSDDSGRDDVRRLELRLEHLEALVQGLQDSVHRESLRQEKRIGDLEAQIQPAALGKALSEDARERGL